MYGGGMPQKGEFGRTYLDTMATIVVVDASVSSYNEESENENPMNNNTNGIP